MSNLVLLISDDVDTDRELRIALTKTTPACQLKAVRSRMEINASSSPSVILLDLTLSQDPAFDVLRWLRTDQRYKDVPVFVLGSQIIEQEVSTAYALGANACLLKQAVPDDIGPIAQGIAAYASLLPESGSALPS
jgi:DNA-binding NarL/FixJ family response regulator